MRSFTATVLATFVATSSAFSLFNGRMPTASRSQLNMMVDSGLKIDMTGKVFN